MGERDGEGKVSYLLIIIIIIIIIIKTHLPPQAVSLLVKGMHETGNDCIPSFLVLNKWKTYLYYFPTS